MKPLTAASASFVVTYGGCLILLALSAAPAPGGDGATPFGAVFAWYVWYTSAAVCLSATAVDLVVGVAWVWLRVSGGGRSRSGCRRSTAPGSSGNALPWCC